MQINCCIISLGTAHGAAPQHTDNAAGTAVQTHPCLSVGRHFHTALQRGVLRGPQRSHCRVTNYVPETITEGQATLRTTPLQESTGTPPLVLGLPSRARMVRDLLDLAAREVQRTGTEICYNHGGDKKKRMEWDIDSAN